MELKGNIRSVTWLNYAASDLEIKIRAIFADLIHAAYEDSATTTLIEHLEERRDYWIAQWCRGKKED